MTATSRLWLFPCLTAVALAAPGAPARASKDQDVTVTAEPALPSEGSVSGYVEYRFKVANHSADQTHRVTVTLPKFPSGFYAYYLRSLTRTVEVPPLSTVAVSLFHPNLALPGSEVETSVDGNVVPLPVPLNGRPQRGRYLSSFSNVPSGSSPFLNYQPCLLVSAGVGVQGSYPFIQTKAGLIPLPLGRDPRTVGLMIIPNCQYNMASTPVTAWPEHWLAYSSYEGVILTAAELTRLDDPSVPGGKGIQDALWQYVEAGGCLVVAGSWKVTIPQPWQRRVKKVQGLDSYYVGFGQCLVVPAGTVGNWRPEQCREPVEAWIRSQQPWTIVRSVTEANQAFPVVASVEIPLRGLFLLMLVFCLVIGPVNLYVLARLKRKLWILWTVPTISLVTSLAVIGYQYYVEGWQGQFRRQGLTILDEAHQRATTIGWAAYYAPLAPSEGLVFSPNTELIPQIASRGYVVSLPLDLDWTDGEQHLRKGWLTARIPAHFMVRKSEARSERLLVKRAQTGDLTLVNQLRADLRRLWLADEAGRIYTASDVSLGGETVLQPTGERLDVAPNPTELRLAFGEDWLRHMQQFTAQPRKYLWPQTYIALLADEPFLEEGLQNAKKQQSEAVVYGLMAP
jgi:hypothetical protein